MAVNVGRLCRDLDELGAIGAGPGGGVTRLALSAEDLAARAWLRARMAEAGLSVSTDPAGNTIGRLGPTSGPALVVGSHLDTVPAGGRFDGALGVLAGLEVARALQEQAVRLGHALEVVAFADEEQARFLPGLGGARAMALGIDPEEFGGVCDGSGVALTAALAAAGVDLAAATSARRSSPEIAAYVELHVEQGPRLEEEGVAIGIVAGIVGITRYGVTVTGQANHAGTTAMQRRRDALVGAARLVLEVNRAVRAEGEHMVGTVGRLKVEPGAPNIVPGRVELVIELRCFEQARLERVLGRLRRLARELEAQGLGLEWQEARYGSPCPMDPVVRTCIARAATRLGYSCRELWSWAGHDAQFMGRRWPAGMIFVPSRGGVSHSPAEYTSPEDLGRGAEVLYATVVELDAHFGQQRGDR